MRGRRLLRYRVEHHVIKGAAATNIRHTSKVPTSRKHRTFRGADENIVVEVPNRCLPRIGIANHPVRVAVAVKVSYESRSSLGYHAGGRNGTGGVGCHGAWVRSWWRSGPRGWRRSRPR